MAEAIGVFASIITVVSLAKPTAKFVKALRATATDADPIAEEILKVASHFEMASLSIDLALRQLKGHCSTISKMHEAPSDVADYIVKNKLAHVLASCSKAVIREMKDVTEGLKSMDRGPRFIQHLKWYVWRKMEVESLFPEIDRVRAYLALVGPILHLEINQYISKRSSDEVVARCMKAEVESLRDQLKMSEGIYRRAIHREGLHSNQAASSESAFRDSADSLLRLSRSMRTNGTIPKKKTSSASIRVYNSRVPSPPRVFVPPTSSQTSGESQRSRSDRSGPSSRVQQSKWPESPRTSQTSQTPQAPRIPRIPRVPQASESIAPSHKAQGTTQAICGYLTNFANGYQSKTFTAMVDPRESHNFISMRAVRDLGLEMTELESHDPRSCSSADGSGTRELLGKLVDVRWQPTRLTRPVALDFWVENCHRPDGYQAVLGQEFAKFMVGNSEGLQ
ncbi:hypothetical protein FZEAL_6958 [Fusarium zealandicum]|uniref:Uncharacterized protein n=1 Tax=Fusarium zealandicum TaxID=1053134 RepID=A0A8H4XIY7_9HYPO|nr:hypothetical protein FZEAL_6958 [Fusarium zealandicum]